MNSPCRICGNVAGNQEYFLREMQFGTRERFRYVKCISCGCLQIAEIPQDISRHYPQTYYSFRQFDRLARRRLRGWFDSRRVEFALTGQGLIGRLAAFVARPLEYVGWMEEAGVGTNASILDVGSGNGRLLLRMRLGGFKRVMGIDPYIPQDIHYSNGVTVLKRTLENLVAEKGDLFDLIMFHHSLEHMEFQQSELSFAARLLAPNGCILIRIPLAEGYAWEHYRENSFQLDAPRHFFLHTRRSMEVLAAQVGLAIKTVEYDSTAQQFIGGEMYQRDIPLNSEQSKKLFGKNEIKHFQQEAKKLNAAGEGDQAVFYLVRQVPGDVE